MNKDLRDQLLSTARINPADYAAQTSHSRLASLGYALAGWLYMLRWQKNTRIMIPASIVVLLMAAWLGLSTVEWAVIILTIAVVWLTEFLNAAVEAAVDLASPQLHPMAKVAKDVAAAAVLLGVVASVIVGLLIFGPHLIERFGLG